jgi:hypothetical protein
MTGYLLPHTICNYVQENITLPLNASLNNYLATLSYINECSDTSSIIEYIISMHCSNLPCTYVNNINKNIQYKLLIDNSDTPKLDYLEYLEKNGCFIVKILDSTTPESIQFLYKLSSSFSKVFLYKPESILHTSIKYAIALNYTAVPCHKNLKIPYYFRMKLNDINSILGQNQLEKIIYKNI